MSKEVFGKLSEAVVDGVTMRGILPLDAEDALSIKDLDPKSILAIKVVKARSTPQLRMYWGLIRLVFENQTEFQTVDDLSNHIKCEIGHCDSFVMEKYEYVIKIPLSISFGKSEQDEFNRFVDRAIDYIIGPEGYFSGMDRDVLLNEVYEMIGIAGFS